MPKLRQVIYVSRATTGISRVAAQNIVGLSIRNNRRADITGLLASSADYFLQVLEGPAASVGETFDRISADPRHDSVTLLADRPIETRRFAEWSMAYVYTLALADDLAGLCSGELGLDVDELLDRLQPDSMMGGL